MKKSLDGKENQPRSVSAAMAGRRRGPGLSFERSLCTSWPSINSTTEEKVLPNTYKEDVDKKSEDT